MNWSIAEYNELMIKKGKPELIVKDIEAEEKKSKFNNERVVVDGILFDSKKEAEYYSELKLLKRYGIVTDFKLQPNFVLQPSYYKNGKKIRAINYKADFKVWYKDGRVEIVDTKGFETQLFKVKKKILEYKYPDITLIVI